MTDTPTFDPQAFAEAWNARDLDRLMAHYAEGAELVQSGLPEPIRGRDNVRQAMAAFLATFTDTRAEVLDAFQGGKRVAVHLRMSGTYKEDLQVGRERTLPAAGRRVSWEVADLLTLDDAGLIVQDRAVVDSESMLAQLGVIPSVQAGGSAEHQH